MARMHKRRRGASGSSRPLRTVKPGWVDLSQEEIEDTIVKLARKGESPSKIGVILRDQYSIPLGKYFTKKKVTRVLREKGIEYEIPEDLMNLIRRAVRTYDHLQENQNDKVGKRSLQLTEAKIRRLANYYISRGRLPKGWKYSISRAKLLVR